MLAFEARRWACPGNHGDVHHACFELLANGFPCALRRKSRRDRKSLTYRNIDIWCLGTDALEQGGQKNRGQRVRRADCEPAARSGSLEGLRTAHYGPDTREDVRDGIREIGCALG